MKTTKTSERVAFCGLFLFITLVINLIAFTLHQKHAQHQAELKAQAERKAIAEAKESKMKEQAEALRIRTEAEKARMEAENRRIENERASRAEAEHTRYLNRYMSSRIERRTGLRTLAVVVSSDDANFTSALANKLAGEFPSDRVQAYPSPFTTAFISDGLFSETLGGSLASLQKLDLADSLDSIILAQESVQYSTNVSLNNIITASARVEAVELPVADKGERKSRDYTANGAGFNLQTARQMAEERILKQFTNVNHL